MIEEEHIHKGKEIMFPDVGTDNDDDSFEDDSSSDYEEDNDLDGSINDEDDSNFHVVDKDELFEHNSEDEIDRYKKMYASGIMWEAEGDGKVGLK